MPHIERGWSAPVKRAKPAASSWPGLYGMMLGAWMLDFRSESEGQGLAIQAIFLAFYMFGLIFFLIGDAAGSMRIRWLPSFTAAGALYLAIGIGSGLVAGQSIYPILRNAMNVFIFISTAYATARVVTTTDPGKLRQLLAWLCLGYTVSSLVIYAITSGGIDVDKVRFQIIGASSLAALGYVVLLAMFRLSRLQLATLLINLAILLFSVTRTFLLAFAAQALVIAVEFRRLFTPRLLLAGLAGLAVIVGVMSLGQGQLTRWGDRLGGEGASASSQNETLNTRLSEWEFMYREWTASPGNFLVGSGLAAKTTYFYSVQAGGRSESMVGFGHNQHLSMLWNGGVLGGLPLLVIMWLVGWMGFRFLRQTARHPALRSDLVFLGAWGATIVLGTLASDMFAATFGLRATSLWYGIGTGLLLGVQAHFDPENAPPRQRRQAPAPARDRTS